MTDVKITSKDPKIKEDRCDLAGCHTIIARGLRPIPVYLFTVRDPENVHHEARSVTCQFIPDSRIYFHVSSTLYRVYICLILCHYIEQKPLCPSRFII